jgi:hypothetical protein
MANRMFTDPKTLGTGVKILGFKFRTNAGSSPTTKKGKGFTVSRTGAGTYAFTIADKYADNFCALVNMQQNAPGTYDAKLQSYDPTTGAGVIVVVTVATGAATDVASHANNWVHLWLQNVNSNAGNG